MQNVNQVVTKLNPNQIEQTKPSETTYRSTEQVFAFVWRGLQAARFIPKDDRVGETDYKYWRHQLKDLTDDQLKTGLRESQEFHGYMTLSSFRELCLRDNRHEASHKPYKALPVKKMDIDRMREKFDQLYLENPEFCPEIHRERLGLI